MRLTSGLSTASAPPPRVVTFNPDATSSFTKDFMKSKSHNTPFLNKTLEGRVELVVLGNEILLER